MEHDKEKENILKLILNKNDFKSMRKKKEAVLEDLQR